LSLPDAPSDPTAQALDRCPGGHALPRDTPRGPCTPVSCAGEDEKPPEPEGPHATPEEFRTPEFAKEVRQGEQGEMKQLAKADAQRRVRLRHLGVPEGLTGAAVDDYVAKEKVDLGILSMAELKWRLLYGNSAERWEAAKFNLEQRGDGKRDGFQGGAAPIIILKLQGGVPWLPGGSGGPQLPPGEQTLVIGGGVKEASPAEATTVQQEVP
jgi:hypothetical protein